MHGCADTLCGSFVGLGQYFWARFRWASDSSLCVGPSDPTTAAPRPSLVGPSAAPRPPLPARTGSPLPSLRDRAQWQVCSVPRPGGDVCSPLKGSRVPRCSCPFRVPILSAFTSSSPRAGPSQLSDRGWKAGVGGARAGGRRRGEPLRAPLRPPGSPLQASHFCDSALRPRREVPARPPRASVLVPVWDGMVGAVHPKSARAPRTRVRAPAPAEASISLRDSARRETHHVSSDRASFRGLDGGSLSYHRVFRALPALQKSMRLIQVAKKVLC